MKAALEAQAHVQKISAAVQAKVHKQVAAVVSKCLSAVYGEDYAFEIEFKARRGKTEAKIWLVKNGHRIDPMNDSGGVRDVVSLGLRLAKLLMERPAKRRMLILDEPFKNIHGREKQQRAAQLITTLAEEMDVQFLIVTGLEWLKIGEVIEL